ncbi:hypothetical protein ACSBOB_00915 [Mesorhizobium sp. ASY16-5R]|uniref:hypothetical protein n=1 Tax=Mesorhizobium sp. ASY16-5R TaxID=3445772 RepID=UPI003FA009B8
MFDVMSMFRQPAVNRLMQPFLTPGADNLLNSPVAGPTGNMLASAGMPIPSSRPDPWAGLRDAIQIDQTKTASASSGPAYKGPLVKHGDGQAGYPDGVTPRSASKPAQTGFQNSHGVANGPFEAGLSGRAPPQGAGKQDEIRRGGDGGNYQYAETRGMQGATGDSGWIPTLQSGKSGMLGGLQQFSQSPFGQKLGDMAAGWAMGGNISDSLAQGGRMMAIGNERRKGKAQTAANVEYLTKNGYDEQAAKAIASDGQALTAAIKQIHESRQPKYGFSTVDGNVVRYDERGNGPSEVVYDGPDASPMTPEQRESWGIPADDRRPYYMDAGKPHALGGAGVNVNVGGERGYDKTVGEGYGKRFLELQEGVQSAGRALNALDVMDQAMSDPGFYSGAASGSVSSLKRYGAALGLPGADGIDSIETFNAMTKQAALDSMGGSLGTGFSNADRDFVIDQVPNLRNTPQGNKDLIDVQRKLNTRKQQIGALAREYAARNDGRIDAGFDDFLAQWAEQNPLFPNKPVGSGAARGAGGATGRQRARNPQTGETLEWDGTNWSPVR